MCRCRWSSGTSSGSKVPATASHEVPGPYSGPSVPAGGRPVPTGGRPVPAGGPTFGSGELPDEVPPGRGARHLFRNRFDRERLTSHLFGKLR